MVTTQRMRIFPISDTEMQAKIEEELDPQLKKAYTEMLEGCIKAPELRIWYAMWLMQLHDGSKQIVGNLSFKGLHSDGSVEIRIRNENGVCRQGIHDRGCCGYGAVGKYAAGRLACRIGNRTQSYSVTKSAPEIGVRAKRHNGRGRPAIRVDDVWDMT